MPSRVRRERLSGSASPKSPILAVPSLGQPDVARLEVAVHDAALVGVLQPLGHLVAELQDALHGHAVVGGFVNEVLDIAAAHELGDHVGLAVLLAEVKDGDDVRVRAEPAHRLRLAADAQSRGVVEALVLDQREGDLAIEEGVLGQEHLLLAALAQELDRLIASADKGGWRGGGGRRGGGLGRRGCRSGRGRRCGASAINGLPHSPQKSSSGSQTAWQGADPLQRRGALGAELASLAVLVATARTLHRRPPLRCGTQSGRNGQLHMGIIPARTRLSKAKACRFDRNRRRLYHARRSFETIGFAQGGFTWARH